MATKRLTRFISISLLLVTLFCCNDKSRYPDNSNQHEQLQEQVNVLQAKMDSLLQALTTRNPPKNNKARQSKKKIGTSSPKNNTTISRPQQLSEPDNSNTWKNSVPQKTPAYSPKNETKAYTIRIGARCCDGSRSSATGRGACSHHGGVCEWLYQ